MGNQKQLKKRFIAKNSLACAMLLMTCSQPIMSLNVQDYAARLGIFRMPTGKELMMIGAGGVFLAAAVYLLGKRWGGNYQNSLRAMLDSQIQEICKIISALETKIQQSESELSIVNSEYSTLTEQALTIFETMNSLPFASERERFFFFGIKIILFFSVSKYILIQRIFKDGSLDNPDNFRMILNNINIIKQDHKKYLSRCFSELSDSSDQAKELRAFMYYFDAEIASHVPSVPREIVNKIKKTIDYKNSDATLLNTINDFDSYFKQQDERLQARRASNPHKMKDMKNLYDQLNKQVEQCIKTAR